MAESRLPKKLRIVLLEKGISFSEWCRERGFNRETARDVACGRIAGKRGESERMRRELVEYFGKDALSAGEAHEGNPGRR